jgi:hypothetical protein
METVLEEYANEKQRSVLRFLWAKRLNATYNNKEMFRVYGGKCLLSKAVHNLVVNVSLVKKLKQRWGSG